MTSLRPSPTELRRGSPPPIQRGEKRKLNKVARDLGNAAPPDKKRKLGVAVFMEDCQPYMSMSEEAFEDSPSIPSLAWYRRLRIQPAVVDAPPKPVALFRTPAARIIYSVPHLSTLESDFSTHTEFLEEETFSHVGKYSQEAPSSSHLTGLPFPEIVFLSMPFYQYAFIRMFAPSSTIWAEPDDDFLKAFHAASLLIDYMPGFYAKGKQSEKLWTVMDQMIPSDSEHRWYTDKLITHHDGMKVNLVLVCRRHNDSYPLIVVEVREHMDEGGLPAFTNGSYLFSQSIAGFERIRTKCGAPALFIELAGMFGAFTEALISLVFPKGSICLSVALFVNHGMGRTPFSVFRVQRFSLRTLDIIFSRQHIPFGLCLRVLPGSKQS